MGIESGKVERGTIMKINVLVVLGFTVVHAHSATYTWNGRSGDGKWRTVKNWTVSNSKYTWPNAQKKNSCINNDCDQIIIDNGDTVRYSSYLSIDGPLDASIAPALILDNRSKLIVSGAIYLANGLGTRGQIGIRDGATLIVQDKLDVGNDGDGGVFVSGGNLIIKKDLGIGSGKYASGKMIVSGKSIVIVDKDIVLSEAHSAKSELIIENGTITVGGTVYLGGKYASDDTALCRIRLKGGILKCENLIFKKKLGKIIYTGGLLLVKADNLNKKKMQKLVNSGKIDVSGVTNWKIVTAANGYTELVAE